MPQSSYKKDGQNSRSPQEGQSSALRISIRYSNNSFIYSLQKSANTYLLSAILLSALLASTDAAYCEKTGQGLQAPEVGSSINKELEPKSKMTAEKYFLDRIAEAKKSKNTKEQIENLILLGNFYAAAGNKAKSEPVLKEALSLSEQSAKQDAYLDALLRIARFHFNNGDYAKARTEYEAASSKFSAAASAASKLRLTLEMQGMLLYTGKYKEAAALSAKIDPLIRQLSASDIVLKANALDQSGEIEYLLGHYAQAQQKFKEALAVLAADKRPHPLDLAIIQNDLGGLYSDLENYELAEKYLNESLRGKQKLVGDSNQIVASTQSNLAKLKTKSSKLDQAEKLLDSACKARKSDTGIAALAYARSLCDLAEVKRLKGQLDESEKLSKQALDIYNRQFGPGVHPDAATASNNLAMVQADRGNYDDAQGILKQALEIKQKALGGSHPDCAIVMNNLGFVADKKQSFTEADKYYAAAQQITTAFFGTQHPALATILNNRSLLAESAGKDAEAEKLQLQAIAIRRKFVNGRNADLVSSLNNLGELYLYEGKFDKAKQSLDEAEKLSKKPDFPDKKCRATLLGNLALLNDRRQDYANAEKWYKEALSACASSYGNSSIEYARALSNLAGLYRVEKKLAEAEPLQIKSLSVRQGLSGADSLDAAREYNNLGELYLAKGDLDHAANLLDKAIKIRLAKLGESNRDTSVTLCALGKLKLAQKKTDDAEQFLNKALKIQAKLLKNNDEKLANTYFALSDLMACKGKKEESSKFKQEGESIMKRAKTGA